MIFAPLAFFTEATWIDYAALVSLIILGTCVFLTGVETEKDGLNSPRWPRVYAELISTGLRSHFSGSGGRSYSPEITVKFDLEGIG